MKAFKTLMRMATAILLAVSTVVIGGLVFFDAPFENPINRGAAVIIGMFAIPVIYHGLKLAEQ